jgi:hypothetical protein
MNPKHVNEPDFVVKEIVYDDNDFSVALGYYEGNDHCPTLAVRWNGAGTAPGFPILKSGAPTWLLLPAKGIWVSEMIQALDKIQAFDKRMKNDFGHASDLQLKNK